MLLFRGNDWTKSLSPDEKQKVTDQWMAWFRRLTDQGKAIAGNPLEPEGKIVSGKNRVVSDGPFAESKEAIGGYFLLDVASFDDALVIAQECPGLPYGVQVEVRPVAAECPLASELKHEAQFANALRRHTRESVSWLTSLTDLLSLFRKTTRCEADDVRQIQES